MHHCMRNNIHNMDISSYNTPVIQPPHRNTCKLIHNCSCKLVPNIVHTTYNFKEKHKLDTTGNRIRAPEHTEQPDSHGLPIYGPVHYHSATESTWPPSKQSIGKQMNASVNDESETQLSGTVKQRKCNGLPKRTHDLTIIWHLFLFLLIGLFKTSRRHIVLTPLTFLKVFISYAC